MLKEVRLRIPDSVYHQASWLAKGRDEQHPDESVWMTTVRDEAIPTLMMRRKYK